MSGLRASQDKSETFKLQEAGEAAEAEGERGGGVGGRLRGGGGAMHMCELLWGKRSAR